MADVAISGLTALGGAPATNDLLVEVDVSDTTQAPTGTTKKMTVANLFTAPTITSGLTVSSGTTALQALTAASVTAAAGGALAWSGRSQMLSPADGAIQFLNAAATASSRLVLGGITTGFPSLRASTATLEVRLGDDSAYTILRASSLQADSVSFANLTGTAKIIGGTTGTTIRNNGDGADNLLISDAGAVSVRSTLGVTSDFAIATSKFTVAAATGNTVAAGSMTATDHIAGSANSFQWTSRSKITSPADGNILLQNAAASAFTQLQFGGTTSAFPSLKRVGTGLVSQLADNSASASFQCQYINTDTPAGGTGAGLWKLGIRVAAAVALVTTQYIEVDIGGTLYKLATVS